MPRGSAVRIHRGITGAPQVGAELHPGDLRDTGEVSRDISLNAPGPQSSAHPPAGLSGSRSHPRHADGWNLCLCGMFCTAEQLARSSGLCPLIAVTFLPFARCFLLTGSSGPPVRGLHLDSPEIFLGISFPFGFKPDLQRRVLPELWHGRCGSSTELGTAQKRWGQLPQGDIAPLNRAEG